MTLLSMQAVTRHFGRRAVLDKVDLRVEPGERIALVGANGSGKTTMLRIAAGTLRPTGGTVEHDAARTGYLAQEAPTYRELTVADHLHFAAKVHRLDWDQATTIQQLQQAGLDRMADQSAGSLSRGQRQRLGIAMAMVGEPDLLLLDEPWTALDTDGAHWLSQRLQHTDAAIVAALHDPDLLAPDRTVRLDGGRTA